MAGAGKAFFSYDRRGHGVSGGSSDAPSMDGYAADLAAATGAASDRTDWVRSDAIGLLGEVKIVALEPATTAMLSGGEAGSHDVEGIGIGFVPPLLDEDLYDEARGIDEQEARRTARLLAKEEGIFAGTSSGLNVVGALQLAAELGEGKTVVTVVVDTGLKYLDGDLYPV